MLRKLCFFFLENLWPLALKFNRVTQCLLKFDRRHWTTLINMDISRIATGEIGIFQNRQATLDFFKSDRNISEIENGDIAIF